MGVSRWFKASPSPEVKMDDDDIAGQMFVTMIDCVTTLVKGLLAMRRAGGALHFSFLNIDIFVFEKKKT